MVVLCRDSGSDTDSNDEEHKVGGIRVFSHGRKSLTHQHWVNQVVTAGGFNVNCTQGPEASHKLNMHLAAARVRHGGANETQFQMLRYLCNYFTFEEMNRVEQSSQSRRVTRNCIPRNIFRLESPIPNAGDSPRRDSVAFRMCFIHRHVRVAVNELYDLLCPHLGLTNSRATYTQLASLRFTFGQRFVREDGREFWGTDSKYIFGYAGRRDMLRLKRPAHGTDAFTCETICFVQVTGVRTICPDAADLLHLVLVRWLEPHPDALERDLQGRPCCPGPLHINNCLWRYARTSRPRPCFASRDRPQSWSRTFTSHASMFGKTREDQQLSHEQEKFAYYDLVLPENIVDTVNLCRTFKPDTCDPVYDTWLESVYIS